MKATPLWTPSTKTVENSRVAQFMAESYPDDVSERGDGPHLEPRREFAPQSASV